MKNKKREKKKKAKVLLHIQIGSFNYWKARAAVPALDSLPVVSIEHFFSYVCVFFLFFESIVETHMNKKQKENASFDRRRRRRRKGEILFMLREKMVIGRVHV